MTNEPATPEKEAFLSNGINVRAEESSDPWENTWNTLLQMALCAHYTDVCDLQQLKRSNRELLLMFKTMSFVLLLVRSTFKQHYNMWLLLFTRWIACYSGKTWRTELMIIVYIKMYTALLEQSVLPLSNWFILSIYFCSMLLSCLIKIVLSHTHCIVTHNSLCGVHCCMLNSRDAPIYWCPVIQKDICW